MNKLIIRQLTETRAVFYNEEQTIVGEIQCLHKPHYNYVNFEEGKELATEEDIEYLESVKFSNYHI
jgi:hypothetical protein